MARSKSNKNQNINASYSGRETKRFSRRSLPLGVNLNNIQDRRLFNPDPYRPPVSISQRQVELRLRGLRLVSLKYNRQLKSPSLSNKGSMYHYAQLPYKLEFVQPKDVLLCAKRKIRSEVMHAMGLAGLKRIFKKAGAGSHNEWSKVGC